MKTSLKKILPAVLLSVIISFSAFAQTNVSGGIYTNATWTLANSPYIVVDTVVVFPGVTLTIQPGVVVKFANGKYMEIRQATLMAVGTSVDSITFTSNSATPTPGIWLRINLNNCVQSHFNFCNFYYSSNGVTGASTSGPTFVTFRNSNFRYNINGHSVLHCIVDTCTFY
ncbi:MAG: hypothetical protein JJE25_11450, partial [Bacteroidia bacterium]|nr:hypothetical protein [Bacteroidia bacterium]